MTLTLATEYQTSSNAQFFTGLQGGKLRFECSADGGTGNYKTVTSGTSVNTGAWVHVVVTYSAGTVVMYVNGAVDTQAVVNTAPQGRLSLAEQQDLGLGAYDLATTPTGFGGAACSLRDIRVYNVAKSASEIAAIFNQHLTPSTIDTAGLLAMYPMQAESGTIGYDVSGNGRHLTLTNITQSTFHAVDSGVNWNYTIGEGIRSVVLSSSPHP